MTQATLALNGWTEGYFYCLNAERKTATQKAGNHTTNHSFSRIFQIWRVMALLNKVNQIATRPPLSLVPRLVTYIPYLSIPIAFLVTSVKEGTYEEDAKSLSVLIPVPTKLGPRTKLCCRFIADHWDNTTRVAMVAGSIGLIVLGNAPYGAAMLASLTYDTLDCRGLIDARISSFVNAYLPLITYVTFFAAAPTSIFGIFCAILAVGQLMPSSTQKADLLSRKIFGITDFPTLQEFQAPLPERKEMSLKEIKAILDCNASAFELNPAHCSKPLTDFVKIPRNYDWKQFDVVSKELNLHKHYTTICNVIEKDRTFIQHIAAEFPEIHEERADFEAAVIVEKVAAKKGICKREYATQWVHNRIEKVVFALEKDAPQQDRKNTANHTACLLGLLPKLSPEIQAAAIIALSSKAESPTLAEIEEISQMVFEEALEDDMQKQNDFIRDPVERCEIKVLLALQKKRERLIRTKGSDSDFELLNGRSNHDQGDPLEENTRKYLSLGFYPPKKENEVLLGSDIIMWNMFIRAALQKMYTSYQKDLQETAEKHLTSADITAYKKQLFANMGLTQEEEIRLLSKYEKLPPELHKEKFVNLILMQLGVIRLKNV